MDGEKLTIILRQTPELQLELQQLADHEHASNTDCGLQSTTRGHRATGEMAIDVRRPCRVEFAAVDARLSGSDVRDSPLECERSGWNVADSRVIAHTRGDVEIRDRPKLEEAACECYGIMQRQIKEWRAI